MPAIEAVFADGVFRPLAPVGLPENERVMLTVGSGTEPPTPAEVPSGLDSMAEMTAFRDQLAARCEVEPDSTALIRAMRYGGDPAKELPPPGPRPQRTPEEIRAAAEWFAQAKAMREQLTAKYGLMPDSTPDIAADRRRDD